MKAKIIFVAMAIMLYAMPGYAQTTTASLFTPSGLSNPDNPLIPSTWYQLEPSIAIDKNNPENVIVTFTTFYYGRQWAKLPDIPHAGRNARNFGGFCHTTGSTPVLSSSQSSTTMPNNAQCYGSVSTCFDNEGNGYIMGLNGDASGFFDIASPSHSDGASWNTSGANEHLYTDGVSNRCGEPVMGKADDYPTSPFVNRYYSAFCSPSAAGYNFPGSFVNAEYSSDNGITWNGLKQLSQNFAGAPNIQTGISGEVYVCWANLGPTTGGSPVYPAGYIAFATSTDGGSSYPAANINEEEITYTPIGVNGTGGDADYGDIVVNGDPTMAVDKSCNSPHNGWIYIAAALQTPGSSSAIGVWSKAETAATWQFQLIPGTSSISLSHTWFPWITVDDVTGVVSVAYYGYTGTDQATTNTYVSFFNPSDATPAWNTIQVSNAGQTPYPACSGSGSPLSDIFPQFYEGNHIGIAAFNNKAFPVWTDRRSGGYQIYIAEVDYTAPSFLSSSTSQDICPDPLTDTKTITGMTNFAAEDEIAVSTAPCTSSGTVTIAGTANISMKAGQSIIIGPGFSTDDGAVYLAEIEPNIVACQTPGVPTFSHEPPHISSSDSSLTTQNIDGVKVYAYPNPATDQVMVGISNNNFQNVSFIIADISGRLMGQYNNPIISISGASQAIDISMFAKGMYIVTAMADGQKYSFKISKE